MHDTNRSDSRGDQPQPPAAGVSRQWATLARLLSRSQRSLQRLFSCLEPAETEWVLLCVCAEAPPEGLPQVTFAEALGVSPAQVSVLVERLRGQGLLDSRRCSLDRRRRLWCLTEAGNEALSQVDSQLLDQLAAMKIDLSVGELDSLRGHLESLVSSLNPSSGRKERAA